uniref:Uncharacterized protein n=1 Tax=Anguilla anguilla TaxID=7936 RepID=A0A0E9VJY1_ANGAN
MPDSFKRQTQCSTK